jgi:hypothetical protein
MSWRRAAALLAALVVVVGCGNQSGDATAIPATEPPTTEPTIVGLITDVVPFEPVTGDCVTPEPDTDPDSPVSSDDSPFCTDPDTAPVGTVLVEEDPAGTSGDSKISFTIGRDTTVLSESSRSPDPLSFADLAEGMTVAAWADGPIMESYPAQATAAAIVVRPS